MFVLRMHLLEWAGQLLLNKQMKRLLLTPIFKRFKKSAFFSSLNQNTCPVYDAEEIKKQEQKEANNKLYP